MSTITIPKIEYETLRKKARFYESLRKIMEKDIFAPPPTKNAKEVINAFSKTKRYNKAFLESLGKGLKRSPCFHS
jgi:hypothetical protein